MAGFHVNVLQVVEGGLSASIQDEGRWGYQRFGVSVSGAMDDYSHAVANLLVGNPSNAATLEIAWHGTAIRFAQPALVAITGGDLRPSLSGVPVPLNRPVLVPAMQTIRFAHAWSGCYAYLAVAGGLDTTPCLGSRSTQVRARLGGWNGRAVQAGDEIPIGAISELSRRIFNGVSGEKSGPGSSPSSAVDPAAEIRFSNWFVQGLPVIGAEKVQSIRAVRGIHFDRLDAGSAARFWNEEFVVSLAMDRMGYRLEGAQLALADTTDVLSLGVARGLVQLPVGGEPIVLMADAATTGGYPVIAHVATVDIGVLAQTQPGRRIRFREIDPEEARSLISLRGTHLRQLARAISFRAGAKGL